MVLADDEATRTPKGRKDTLTDRVQYLSSELGLTLQDLAPELRAKVEEWAGMETETKQSKKRANVAQVKAAPKSKRSKQSKAVEHEDAAEPDEAPTAKKARGSGAKKAKK